MILTKKQLFERVAIAALYAAILALKIIALTTQAINTDEPQHLHVAWGWTAGLLQYRDVFDNHTPLFHLLFACLLKVVLLISGDTVTTFFIMRASMSAVFLLNGWLTFRLIAALGIRSRTARHLLTLLALTLPYSFLVSNEFRTDNLWVSAWLVVLLCIVRTHVLRDYFVLGVAFAVCALVSFKTLALIAGVASATIVIGAVHCRTLTRESVRVGLQRGFALAAGALAVVSVFVGIFWTIGDFSPMVYGVIQHNLVPALGNWKHDELKCAFPLSIAASYFLVRFQPRSARVWIILLHGALTAMFFVSFWPLITPQDFLPLYPLAPLFILWMLPARLKRESEWWPFAFAAILFFLVSDLVKIAPWTRAADPMISEIRAMLSLTKPDDFVMDEKGEALFRRRPFFYALERLTLERFKRGTIKDLIPEQLRLTDTKVVRLYRIFPNTQKFLGDNYLPILEYVQVAGKRLQGEFPLTFNIQIPAEYVFMHDASITPVLVDNHEVNGYVFLGAGEHVLQRGDFPEIYLLWRNAYEKGFVPHPPESASYRLIEPFSAADISKTEPE